MASDVSSFEFERGRRGAEVAPALDADAVAAFGASSAYALLGMLGPTDAANLPDCECNIWSVYCGGGSCIESPNTCEWDDSGYGRLWTWDCNGLCYS